MQKSFYVKVNNEIENYFSDEYLDKDYLEISSPTGKAKIALKSNADITRCKYNVTFKITENGFENKYISNSGKSTLKEQLMLRLKGYKTENLATYTHTYNLDLNELDNESYTIKDIFIDSDAESNTTTEHNWDINLIFRNYKDYNQTNNSNKKIVGKLKFEIISCERIIEE